MYGYKFNGYRNRYRVSAVHAVDWLVFFHKDYEATLLDTYGKDYENQLVIEGGELASSTNDTAK